MIKIPIQKSGIDPKMFPKLPKGVEVITSDKEKSVRREFENAVVFTWKTASPIFPKMYLEFRASIIEVYASTTGRILVSTPFWRGRLFTKGVMRHEGLHWSIYPKDVFRGLRDLYKCRSLIFEELGIDKNDKNWGQKFPYEIQELQLYQNILGDYLINVHIALLKDIEWRALWQYLVVGGNKEKRPSCFKVYLSAYPPLLPHKNLPKINLNDAKAEADRDEIVRIMNLTFKGKITKPFALKELAKILHKYYEDDKKHGKDPCQGQGSPNCPKCGANDWEVKDILEKDKDGNPTKVKVRCRKCGFEHEINIDPTGTGAMMPSSKAHGIQIKWNKTQIDKIHDASQGASRNDLGKIGIDISKEDFVEASQRARIRRFIRENVVVAKELRRSAGERIKVSTDVWQMGDSLLNINIPSSELASLGIEGLRMIPTLTLRKNVFETTKGTDVEKLKGVKYFAFLDVSGSMSGMPERKALAMLKEIHETCKNLSFEFHLCLFSTRGKRIPKKEIDKFFKDSRYRQSQGYLGGGTVFTSGLKLFSIQEYKDANICMVSDCDLGDIEETREKLLEIANVTNSFKIIIIRESHRINDAEIKSLQKQWFPNEEVKILGISTSDSEFSYEKY